MSPHVIEQVAAQRWSTVVRSEVRRHLGSRRFRVRMAVIVGLGVLAGLGALAFVAAFDPRGAEGAAGSVPVAMETAAGVVAVLAGLAALSSAAAETSDGTVLSSLLVVPNRLRLLTARAVAPMVTGAVAGLLAAGLVLAGGFAVSGGTGIDVRLAAMSMVAAALVVPLTALLGFLTGTLARRGAAAMAVAMGALLVLPLAIGAAQLAAPPALTPLLSFALAATPGVAVMQALSVTSSQPGAVPVFLMGLGMLAAWIVIVAVGAHARFRREGHNA